MTTLTDLAKVKAIFQQRAMCAVMGITGEPERSGIECVAAPTIAVADATIQKKAASPTRIESE
jgi:hypothetical protein